MTFSRESGRARLIYRDYQGLGWYLVKKYMILHPAGLAWASFQKAGLAPTFLTPLIHSWSLWWIQSLFSALHSPIMGLYVPPSFPCDFAVAPTRMAWVYFPTALMLGLAMWFVLVNGYKPTHHASPSALLGYHDLPQDEHTIGPRISTCGRALKPNGSLESSLAQPRPA